MRVRSNSFVCMCTSLWRGAFVHETKRLSLQVCAALRRKETVCVGVWTVELKALELTGWEPGPPSQLHHPTPLFSWVAGLITDPCIGFNTHTSTLLIVPAFNLVMSFIGIYPHLKPESNFDPQPKQDFFLTLPRNPSLISQKSIRQHLL